MPIATYPDGQRLANSPTRSKRRVAVLPVRPESDCGPSKCSSLLRAQVPTLARLFDHLVGERERLLHKCRDNPGQSDHRKK